MNRIMLGVAVLCACTSISKTVPPLRLSGGTVHRMHDFPSRFIQPRNIDIWLPDDYNTSEAHNVLYMHDGQMLFDSTTTWNGQEWGVDEVLIQLMGDQLIGKTLVVGIWSVSANRHADYFPQKPFLMLPQDYRDSLVNEAMRDEQTPLFSTDVQSDAYLRYIVQEIKPYVDANYATHPTRDHTFIAGSSMGGLISLYAICEYPRIFGGAACLSTHWPGTFQTDDNPIPQKFADYLQRHLPDPAHHKFYFDYGTKTLDALYEPYQKQIDEVMVRNGYNASNWKTLKFRGADHSENAWRKRLHIPITFLLGDE
ncbi:MAG: esterase [Caldithrix sp.]|nr:esterase [Caldithrix sp.]